MDETQRKKALRIVPYGLYLMSVRRAEVRDVAKDLNAFVASWVTQVSFKPPMLVVGVKRDAHSNEMVKESKVFTLNILGAEQKELAQRFFKDVEVSATQMAGVPYYTGKHTGCAVFPDTPAHLECVVRHVYDGENDHSVVVGEVVDAAHRRDAKPLTHAETGWHYAG
ncbi:MAG TPA: flavin reductase family protein [Candidatus Thermoplasmatota archaeon]|nr:flavin reductase family protein [Candidatus Thermoplasmatota archaeon]